MIRRKWPLNIGRSLVHTKGFSLGKQAGCNIRIVDALEKPEKRRAFAVFLLKLAVNDDTCPRYGLTIPVADEQA
jgi:hypothetical protein